MSEHIDVTSTKVTATFTIDYLEDGTQRVSVRTYRFPVNAARKLTEDELAGTDFGDLEPDPWHQGGVAILDPYRDASNAAVMMSEPQNIAAKVERDLREIAGRHDKP